MAVLRKIKVCGYGKTLKTGQIFILFEKLEKPSKYLILKRIKLTDCCIGSMAFDIMY